MALKCDYNKFVKKFTIGLALVLLGFVLGGVAFYAYEGHLESRRRPFISTPVRIRETARAFSDIVKSVSPTVVNIAATRKRQAGGSGDLFDFSGPFDDQEGGGRSEQNLGSGVIVSPDGYIITNNHVVENSDDIRVTLFDKRSFRGRVVGTDPKSDLAVLKIDEKGLPAARWGDSDALEVGEFVLAIGNPYSLSHTVTMGIISAVGRANVGIADYEDFIQTDAAINPGNSGGPLVNVKGEIIGINTAIFSRSGGYQGIGFAVPSNMARLIMGQLEETGRVVRGWLGVNIQELTPEMGKIFGLDKPVGALVSDLAKGGPALDAGVRRGDVITAVNGKEIEDPSMLKNLVAEAKPGAKVTLTIVRDSRRINLAAEVRENPGDQPPQKRPAFVPRVESMHMAPLDGLKVAELGRDIKRQLGLPASEKGVVVVDMDDPSPALEAGLKRGDIIEEINRKEIRGVNDFLSRASRASSEDAVLILANRMGKRFYISLKQY